MAVKLGNGNWAVKEDKLLAYNDNSGKFFNKEFDFSRGSSATFVDKDGLIKTAGLQATNLVNNGDFSELGVELVVNGSFDTDSDWTKGTGITISNGVASSDGTSNNFDNILVGSVSQLWNTSKYYEVSVEVKSYTSGNFKLNNSTHNITNAISSVGVHTVIWQPSNANSVIAVQNSGTPFNGSIDNVSVKQVDPNNYWTLASSWSFGDGVANYTDTANNQIAQSINLNAGTYKLKFNISNATGSGARIWIGNSAGAVSYTDNTYQNYINGDYTINIVVPSNQTSFAFYGNLAGSSFSIDNISVQEIQTDTPRIDFSDSVKGALLLEPQSTNLLEFSENLKKYENSNTICTSNYAISPDGTKNATRVDFTASFTNALGINGTVNNGETITQSVFVKYIDAQFVQLWFGSGGLGGGNSNFDLINGTTSNPSGSLSTMKNMGNGWWRISSTRTAASTASDTGVFKLVVVDSLTSSRFGDEANGSVLVFGGQYEKLSYPTSYIPTFGSISTRIADVCNNSGSAQDFNSEEGVLYAEIAALANDGTVRYLALSDGTHNNRVTILYYGLENRIRAIVSSGGTNSMDKNFIVTSVLDFHKIAVVFKENDFSLWIDGFERRTDTSGLTPIGLDTLEFRLSGANNFFGKVREVQVFTEAKSDAFLQALTTI